MAWLYASAVPWLLQLVAQNRGVETTALQKRSHLPSVMLESAGISDGPDSLLIQTRPNPEDCLLVLQTSRSHLCFLHGTSKAPAEIGKGNQPKSTSLHP